ncbi:efflux transporter outer membrane subunit [Halothiobacillus sp.]|uniref:efflux transporter outer membrane subunit n=1 Tax=Halothiobacillus sp. TaxID=1891311 RepID=UPI002AD1DBE9|nr:efflux transporter outer membrane subunit [Halothiobacillus sp.]
MRDCPARFHSMWVPLRSALPLGFILLGLTGCATVGPNFRSPEAPAVDRYTHARLPDHTRATPNMPQGDSQHYVASKQAPVEWWQMFHNAPLNALVAQGLNTSPTLAAAEAKFRQAQQTFAAQSGSTELPQVNGKLSAQSQGINNSAFGQPGGKRSFELYNAGLTVSYNLDLFGANRRALEALAAQTDYQHYALNAARLTLAGNIVIQAITQAMLNEQISTTQAIIHAQQDQLDLVRQRLKLGAATRGDELTLQTQIQQTRATLPPLNTKRSQANHLLATLTGQMPGAANIPQFTLADFTLPASVPVVVPSEWVRARPDIQASEALLHAATAQYGVAVADLYPQINLSGTLGSQSISPQKLFTPDSLIWSLLSGLTQPIFNGGLKAGKDAAHEALSAAAANYQQTVLDGLRNVADVLQASANDADTLAAQAAAEQSARESLSLVEQQLKLGSANYLQLLIAQQQAAQTRLLTLAARAQRLTDTVALYQAMGGGTQAAQAPMAKNKSTAQTPTP